MISLRDRYRGCLLGGAVGDALGGGIEFLSLAEIRRRHGPAGVTGYVPAYGRTGAITDDTQMTLFTAEGLLRNQRQPSHERDAPAAIWRAYRRWLDTQSGVAPDGSSQADGWLMTQDFLHHQRSAGITCLSAMHAGNPGSTRNPANHSKGCGGVMRVAPIGLAGNDPFSLGCQAAALTHGHPSGYHAAGALAVMISQIVHGHSLSDAAVTAITVLRQAPGADQVTDALAGSLRAAEHGPLSAGSLGRLGEGWVAEEALAIATHCALTATSFRSGVLHAVNHSGDSDSTGAICGNLLGAALGAGAIDGDLLAELEGRDIILRMADDLYGVFAEGQDPPAERYPAEPGADDRG
jgi:ADP-ribosylglycohydrolase